MAINPVDREGARSAPVPDEGSIRYERGPSNQPEQGLTAQELVEDLVSEYGPQFFVEVLETGMKYIESLSGTEGQPVAEEEAPEEETETPPQQESTAPPQAGGGGMSAEQRAALEQAMARQQGQGQAPTSGRITVRRR